MKSETASPAAPAPAPSPDAASVDAGRYEVTRNSCVVCSPLGATLVFAGVERGMTLLHGSQGCATYIRRYTISHFREPLDVASSSFTEHSAVFGGAGNLRLALANVLKEYRPALVGVATTCLAETIGEDAGAVRSALGLNAAAGKAESGAPDPDAPLVVAVSTPAYKGSHRDGFRAAQRALAEAANPEPSPLSETAGGTRVSSSFAPDPASVAVFPALVSPADLRSLKADCAAFGLDPILCTDYSDTLDGGPWKAHRLLPAGGTPVARLREMKRAAASLEFGVVQPPDRSAAAYLEAAHGVRRFALGLPLGVAACDAYAAALSEISGRPLPAALKAERARLLDSYVDGHKYVFGRRALLYGDPDSTEAVAAFLKEIGMGAVLPAGEGRDFRQADEAAAASAASGAPVELVIGSSKGLKTAAALGVPLVRIGFPVHDRFGAQRQRLLGYGGTQEFFDRIVNALIEKRQEDNHVGYTYY